MQDEKRWLAVYTRPKWETKVSNLLARKNIDTYCPMNRSVRNWADRKKIVFTPLFSSYVFVHVSMKEHLAIQQTSGVLNFVFWLGKHAVIKNEEIEAIKAFLLVHNDVIIEKMEVNIADRVRILDGPLIHREGNILEIRNHTVKISLPSLGCVMIAEVPKKNIEIIREPKSSNVKSGLFQS